MEVIARLRNRQGQGLGPAPRQCSTPGCIHSASFEVVLLGTEHIPLCRSCKTVWVETWDRALNGWPDEAVAA